MVTTTTTTTTDLDIARPETWPLWLALAEVAAVLRLSKSTIYFLHESGKLRARRFGRTLRWHRDQVVEYAH